MDEQLDRHPARTQASNVAIVNAYPALLASGLFRAVRARNGVAEGA